MPECYICFDDEASNADLICCEKHQFHVCCLQNWASTRGEEIKSCLLCRKPFNKDLIDYLGFKKLQMKDIGPILRQDDLDQFTEYFFRRRNASYSQLIEWGLEFKAFKILNFLKRSENMKYSQTYILNILLDPSHQSICWLLGNFDMPAKFVVSNANMIEFLMQHERYIELTGILRYCSDLFGDDETFRALKFMVDTILTKAPKGLDNDCISYLTGIASFNPEKACFIKTNLLPRLTLQRLTLNSNHYQLYRLLDICRNCGSCHFWDVVLESVRCKNYVLLELMLNYEPHKSIRRRIDRRFEREIPYNELADLVRISSEKDRLLKIIESNFRFEDNPFWWSALKV